MMGSHEIPAGIQKNSRNTWFVHSSLVTFMAEPDMTADAVTAEMKLFPWWLFLLWGLLTVLIGLAFLLTPALTLELFVTFLGAYWLVGGIFIIGGLVADRSFMGLKILLAVVNIFAGLLILLYPIFSTLFLFTFLVLFIGFWAIFIGAVHLYHAWTAKDPGNGVLGAISIVFGILILAKPFVAVALLPFIAGGFCIISGLATLYVAMVAKSAAPAA